MSAEITLTCNYVELLDARCPVVYTLPTAYLSGLIVRTLDGAEIEPDEEHPVDVVRAAARVKGWTTSGSTTHGSDFCPDHSRRI